MCVCGLCVVMIELGQYMFVVQLLCWIDLCQQLVYQFVCFGVDQCFDLWLWVWCYVDVGQCVIDCFGDFGGGVDQGVVEIEGEQVDLFFGVGVCGVVGWDGYEFSVFWMWLVSVCGVSLK